MTAPEPSASEGGWMVATSECGCSMMRAEFVPDRRGVAPCGATYGTAAGPNDGVTHCGACGVVHPVEVPR